MARPYLNPSYFFDYKQFIPAYDDFLLAQETLPPVVIRRNHLKCSKKIFAEFLERHLNDGAFSAVKKVEFVDDCYEISAPRAILGGMWEHHVGMFYMQGASSVLPVMALAPRPGERVLDLCAAPGGKTALIAEMMQDKGLLVANEPSHARRRILKANIDRMGATNVCFTDHFGEKFPLETKFDCILLDGPCSAEGSLRGTWSKVFDYERNNSYREGLQRTQIKLLNRACELLKDGGRLVYSTCTYDPLENEAQVSKFLDTNKNMEVVSSDLSGPWLDGIDQWQGHIFDSSVKKCKRVYPHKFNSWGFFIATFIKH